MDGAFSIVHVTKGNCSKKRNTRIRKRIKCVMKSNPKTAKYNKEVSSVTQKYNMQSNPKADKFNKEVSNVTQKYNTSQNNL
jgi:hypothetical protein